MLTTVPVSCKRSTLSQPHACPRRSTLEDQSGSHAPSSPHSAGALPDLQKKNNIHFKAISWVTLSLLSVVTTCVTSDNVSVRSNVCKTRRGRKLLRFSTLLMHKRLDEPSPWVKQTNGSLEVRRSTLIGSSD